MGVFLELRHINKVRSTWVIVRDFGCVPERKLPMSDDRTALRDFLRELVQCRSDLADITVLHLMPTGPDVQCGREWLSMFYNRWYRAHLRKKVKALTT